MVNERTVTKKWTVVLRQRSSEEGNTHRVTRTMPQFVDKGGNIFKFFLKYPGVVLSALGPGAARCLYSRGCKMVRPRGPRCGAGRQQENYGYFIFRWIYNLSGVRQSLQTWRIYSLVMEGRQLILIMMHCYQILKTAF